MKEIPGSRAGQVGPPFWRRESSPTVQDAWEKLLVDGWTIVADSNPALGFDPTFREYVNSAYFDENGVLEPEKYDVFPPDRKRARGTVEINFSDEGNSTLQDTVQAAVVNRDRGVHKSERVYAQTHLACDPHFAHWLTKLVELIPSPVERMPEAIMNACGYFSPVAVSDNWRLRGEQDWEYTASQDFYKALTRNGERHGEVTSTILRRLAIGGKLLSGVNLFEVRRDVVSGPHQDNTHWNAITVVDKDGTGATSQLFELHASDPFLEYTLKPGQTLIVNDRRFRHSATPLQPPLNRAGYRRTIVCTFDFV